MKKAPCVTLRLRAIAVKQHNLNAKLITCATNHFNTMKLKIIIFLIAVSLSTACNNPSTAKEKK